MSRCADRCGECAGCAASAAAVERVRRWRAANPGRRNVQEGARRQVDPEPFRARERRWKAGHPEQVRESKRLTEATRRAGARGVEGRVTSAEWADLLDRFDSRCYVCAGPADAMDHVVPLSRGGPHDVTNVRPACETCNRSKGARPLGDWLPRRLRELP